ncbi:MAG: ABC transporter substrate-binding protein [Thermodesulfobacteriota bacterium]|nr:ABC transporter substrate-binding protein [Thermodesulfobacteriota bacterium]
MMKKRCLSVFFCVIVVLGFFMPVSLMGAEPVVIGLPTSLGYLEGYESRDGALMAVDEINAQGGVKVGGVARPFKIVETDTRDSEPGVPVSDALMAYEKLILQHKPHAIVTGFFTSESLLASMDITSKHKLPYLGTIAMSPKLQAKVKENYDSYKYVFRLCMDAVYFVKSYLSVLKKINTDFGFTRAFILTEEALWAKAIGGMTSKWLKGQGWEVTGHQTFPKGISDFSPSLLKVRNTKAQVIVFICSRPESVIFADQWRTMRIPALLTGCIPPLCGEDIWKVHKGKVNGIINLVEAGTLAVETMPASVKFHEDYRKRYGKPPGASHGTGAAYEAVYVLKEAIERAGTLDGDKLVSELEKTDRIGATGRLRFDKGHQAVFGVDPNEACMIFDFQWQKPGKRVVIAPKAVATGNIQLPEWMGKK